MEKRWFGVLPVGSVVPALLVASLAAAALGHPWARGAQAREAAGPGLILVAQPSPVGQIEKAVGTVVVKRADGRTERLGGGGSLALYEGDECRTERGGKALIRLTDGTQVAVNRETTFVVRVRMETGRGMTRIFKLLLGEMWMKTSGPAPIEVEAPAATAAIKGTEFHIQVQRDGKSVLTVLEGEVEFRNGFCSPCRTAKATQSVAEQGKRCTAPVAVDPRGIVAWIADVVR